MILLLLAIKHCKKHFSTKGTCSKPRASMIKIEITFKALNASSLEYTSIVD